MADQQPNVVDRQLILTFFGLWLVVVLVTELANEYLVGQPMEVRLATKGVIAALAILAAWIVLKLKRK